MTTLRPAESALPSQRVAQFGSTDQVLVQLVIRTGAAEDATRQRIAELADATLRAAGVRHDCIRTTPIAVVIEVTSRLTGQPATELLAACERWRGLLTSGIVLPAPHAGPTRTPADLATALMVASPTNAEARSDEVCHEVLTQADLVVFISGGGADHSDDSALTTCHSLLSAALRPARAAAPIRRQASNHQTAWVPQRHWYTVPGMTMPLVRWYRELPPAGSQVGHLARAVANICFGGVFGSQLVDVLRRQRGLSYIPQSSLVRHDGQDFLVIDVPTSPGLEIRCDEAVKDALDDFTRVALADEKIRAGVRYLLGRTLVDRDSLAGILSETVSRFDGSDQWSTSETPSAMGLLDGLDPAIVREQIRNWYRAGGFSALILSGGRPPDDWKDT